MNGLGNAYWYQNGTLYDVSDEGGMGDHVGFFFSMDHPELFGLTDSDVTALRDMYESAEWTDKAQDAFAKTWNSGAIRIRIYGHGLVAIQLNNPQRRIQEVQQVLLALGKMGPNTRVQVEDPWGDYQPPTFTYDELMGMKRLPVRSSSKRWWERLGVDFTPPPTLWYENDHGDRFVPDVMLSGDDVPEGYKYQHSQFPTHLHHDVLRITEDGSEPVIRGESGWPEDLVLKMVESGDYSLSDAILVAANACERCLNALSHKYGLEWGYPEGSDEWKKANTECEFCTNPKRVVESKMNTWQRKLGVSVDPSGKLHGTGPLSEERKLQLFEGWIETAIGLESIDDAKEATTDICMTTEEVVWCELPEVYDAVAETIDELNDQGTGLGRGFKKFVKSRFYEKGLNNV